MSTEFCIFLTGTIYPPYNILNLVHKNENIREQDYIDAIKKWLLLPYPIIFCENSGYQSEKINDLFKNKSRCQYIKFVSNKNSKSMGEADIFKFAFAKSELLQNSNYIIKCTGRYNIKNINKILEKVTKDSNQKPIDIWADLSKSLTYSDSRFFVFKPSFFYSHLIHYFNIIDEEKGIYFEHCLARSIHSCLASGSTWNFLPEPAICEGMHGTAGFKYKNDFLRVQKRKILLTVKRKIISI